MSLLIKHFYRFAEFTIDTEQRVLLHKGKPLALSPKVFETLLILVENSGRIVDKEVLMSRLWPDTFVEESNLTFNIMQVRRSLGDNAREPLYIETVPRRGYRFIATVEEILSDTKSDRLDACVETSDLLPDGFVGLEAEAPLRRMEGDRESSTQIHDPGSDSSIDLSPIRPIGQKDSGRRAVMIAASLILVLAIGILFIWRFSKAFNPAASPAVDRDAAVVSPLKLEKLSGIGQSRFAAISPDGKHIAYTRYFKQRCSIWLTQLATNTNVEIVPPGDSVFGLAFTNSGDSIYFARSGSTNALYSVSFVGGVATKITDSLEGDFSISFDDRRIAFVRKSVTPDGRLEFSIFTANSDGSNEHKLLTGTYPDKFGTPIWSPDGQSIICSQGNSDGGGLKERLIQVRISDGEISELSRERFFHITKIVWLPDRNALVMIAKKEIEESQLWRVSYPDFDIKKITGRVINYQDLSIASGTDKAVATQISRISDIWVGSSREPQSVKKISQAVDQFCWTPDARVIYSSSLNGNRDLWIMNADGSEQKQLTSSGQMNTSPVATPDGRYIVFVSNRTGSYQIWRMNLDGSNQVQLTANASNEYPATTPDGKWVIFNGTDHLDLWRVSIDGGEPTRIADYMAFQPAISPDGRLIACRGRAGQKQQLLILSVEGGPPLKRIELAAWFSRVQWTTDGKTVIYSTERDGVEIIMKQPLGGGPPLNVVDFGGDVIFDFGYSSDGQSFAVNRGSWQHDLVLISGLLEVRKSQFVGESSFVFTRTSTQSGDQLSLLFAPAASTPLTQRSTAINRLRQKS